MCVFVWGFDCSFVLGFGYVFINLYGLILVSNLSCKFMEILVGGFWVNYLEYYIIIVEFVFFLGL